jgi:mannose-1-phosphate guanylyltransferase/mannose-6-phosphate isomerase
MAGGSGTRLWPLSRAGYPKQFLVLQGNESPLQQAAQQTGLLRHPGFHSTVPKE